jgi:hypothetical protein
VGEGDQDELLHTIRRFLQGERIMKRNRFWLVALAILVSNVALTVTTTRDARAQEAAPAPEESKYSLKVPGGLAFAEFRGYEDWAVVAVHNTEDLLKVVVGNPVAIGAFRAGIPGNGRPFPDGAKMAKVEWKPKKSPDFHDVTVPGAVYDVDFMVKDARRFPDSGGWGYAVFRYDPASDMYEPATRTHRPPQGNDARCGAACHTSVKGKDYVFTEYAQR